MKKLKFLSAVAMATVLLTSCLDGGKNEQSGVSYGVVGFSTDAMGYVAYTADEVPVYASGFNNLKDDECVFLRSTLIMMIRLIIVEKIFNGYCFSIFQVE